MNNPSNLPAGLTCARCHYFRPDILHGDRPSCVDLVNKKCAIWVPWDGAKTECRFTPSRFAVVIEGKATRGS